MFSYYRIAVFILGFFLTGAFSLNSKPASAENARLSNVVITNTRDNLLLFMETQNAFSEKIKTATLSGVPVSFSFYITLVKVRNFWIDRTIRDKEVTHTVVYDNLKKEFEISRSWDKGEPVTTKSFEEAQHLMTEIKSFKIAPLKRLIKGNRYQLRIRAKLNKLTLPYYLDTVLFFISRWDFETDWYTIDFIY
ncbi:MAG: DUF4390 domain-containing protein [Proteobacteria bacterium]|nr:DUF4390 domain-containing protein [Pseudomonadota bacterium]